MFAESAALRATASNAEVAGFLGRNPVAAVGRAETAPVTAGGTANAATATQLSGQLVQQNLARIAAQDTRLAAALRGSSTGNRDFGIGSGSAAEADRLGRIFVGDGATINREGFWVSADRTRIYRPPSPKNAPARFNPTGVQANFVTQTINPISGRATVVGNGHMVITK